MSTVIGNRFVENMPLNGRSFNSLIDLAPGVVLTPSNFYDQGQFSVGTARGRMQITSWSMESVRLTLPARADFFNIFNHPNFGPPVNYMTSPLFGRRPRCSEPRSAAAAKPAASIRSTRSAARARRSWGSSSYSKTLLARFQPFFHNPSPTKHTKHPQFPRSRIWSRLLQSG